MNQSSDAAEHLFSTTAYLGNLSLVKTLIEQGADVNAQSDIFGTPLVNAARQGHLTLVQFLLSKGADVDGAAVQWTDDDREKRDPHRDVFLEKFLLLYADWGQWTALGAAAFAGHEEIVKILLNQGVKFSKSSCSFFHSIAYAAMGGNVNILRMIIACADFDAIPQKVAERVLENALKASASKGHLESVVFLLDAGAPVNFTSVMDGERSALWYATDQGRNVAIELLVERGANVDEPDWWNDAPIAQAVDRGFP